ncbi:MAG: serine hydrolase [Gemmatimonadaceae bacterium]|nr:serine hydrolase [Gemmatimonadaceae bacterium]
MRPFLPVLLAVAGCTATPALTPSPEPREAPSGLAAAPSLGESRRAARIGALRGVISAIIATQPGAEVGVWYHDLGRGDTLGFAADSSFHAASTMKVPVMIELFRRADAGAIRLDHATLLVNRFRSIVDGSSYSLSPSDDSDTLLYAKVGTMVTWRELNERMITRSSNLATNYIIDTLGAGAVTATAHALGATGMQVLRGVEDQKAFDRGLNNTATPRALGVLLETIEMGRAASPAACDTMRSVLLRDEFRTEIPAGLPPGTPVAHKTGSITGTLHDAAIVYPPGRAPYVLVVLTRKIADPAAARRLIASISRAVWERE